MTLCTAWIRQTGDTEELIFATDSVLTGGEVWKQGIKLFELPRKDCLICFAGRTERAYPLVLNLISSLQMDKYLQSTQASIAEVIEFVAEMFTKLVKTIDDLPRGTNIHEVSAEAKFLFGGWDWKQDSFRVWKLYYSEDVEGFIFDELTRRGDFRFHSFLGDPAPEVEQRANDNLTLMLIDRNKLNARLDTEPIEVLRQIANDPSVRAVDGSLQIAKVYKSSRTEFFGIYWPSSEGKPHFQGREYNETQKPLVRYFDPDSFELMETGLPVQLHPIDFDTYGEDLNFVQDCYPNGQLKEVISEKEKHQLEQIFQEIAYRQFIDQQQAQTIPSSPNLEEL